jgi:hypothetical protein
MKAYVCNRFPSLTIGASVHFREGSFETDDPEVIALIEKNDWFGVHIHPRDLPDADAGAPPAEAPAAPPEEPEESTTPRVRHGGRGSR